MKIIYSRKEEFKLSKRFDAFSCCFVPENERSYHREYEALPKKENFALKIVRGKNYYEKFYNKISELSKD